MDSGPGVRIGLSSLFLNAANFLLFDLLLAAVVYRVTADLAGLANSISALRGREEAIAFYSPTFVGVGVGITCTRKRAFYALAFLRLVSIFFIFISSMSFIGGTDCIPAEKEANVTVLGKFSEIEDRSSLSKKIVTRQGCQGRTNSTVYYGEIRDNSVCELNLSRIRSTVHFDITPKRYDGVNFTSCSVDFLEESGFRCDGQVEDYIHCRKSSLISNVTNCVLHGTTSPLPCRRQDFTNRTFTCGPNSEMFTNCYKLFIEPFENYRCENAMISCRQKSNRNKCMTTMTMNNIPRLCAVARSVWPKLRNASQTGKVFDYSNAIILCKKARGFDWTRDDWFPYFGRIFLDLDEAAAAMYASGSERRIVDIEKRKSFTTIAPFWFAILGVKLLMLLGLGVTALVLRRFKGYERVANDEVGLGELLVTSTTPLDQLTSEEGTVARTPQRDIFVEMQEDTVRISKELNEESEMLRR